MKHKLKRGLRITRYVVYKETLVDFREHFWAFTGSFIGISAIAILNAKLVGLQDQLFLIGSFGASSVLVYGVIQSPLSQPRNLIGGHLLSALLGVTVQKLCPDIIWLASALAVSLSIVLMQITRTLHPPGGATALIAVIGTDRVRDLGYVYVFSPVLTGAVLLLLIALVFNNISKKRQYPAKIKVKKKVIARLQDPSL